MTSIIQLGSSLDDLRAYNVIYRGAPQLVRNQANPFAARVNTSGEFDEEDAWESWVMTNWQSGISRTDGDGGGSFYSENETRFQNRIFLPPPVSLSAEGDLPNGLTTYPDPYVNNPIAVGASEDIQKISFATEHTDGSSLGVGGVFVLLESSVIELTVEFHDAGNGPSGSALTSVTFTPDAGTKGYHWFFIQTTATLTGTGDWHVVLYPTDSSHTITVPAATTTGLTLDDAGQTYDGSSWSAGTHHIWHVAYADTYKLGSGNGFVNGDGTTLYSAGDDTVYSSPGSTGYHTWTSVYTPVSSTAITSMVRFGGGAYIGLGNSANMHTLTIPGESGAAGSVPANLLVVFEGLLWRSVNNTVYYSNNGTSWTGPITICPSDYAVRGMAGIGQDMYVSTDDGFYVIAPGDRVRGLFPWDSVGPENGKGMKASEDGSIYIPLRSRIVRYSATGTAQDIWMTGEDGLPGERLGDIDALAIVNGQAWVAVNPPDSADPSTVWAYNGQGWHHIATLPPQSQALNMHYFRGDSRVWIGNNAGYPTTIKLPTTSINPLYDTSSTFHPSGWIEWDKFWGGSRTLEKDWESVTLWGRDLGFNTRVKVYWKDQRYDFVGSQWQLLGTMRYDGQELRWADLGNRPTSQWLRIGLLLETDGSGKTPVVEALTVKFRTMVNDRYKWSLTIPVGDNQEMPDGTINTRTAEFQLIHLEQMIEQVQPLYFVDELGMGYEVKVTSHSRQMSEYENYGDGNQAKHVYQLELEQTWDGQYMTLAVYKEGDWTPSIDAATTSPSSVTYSRQVGKYRRIGDLVFVSFSLRLSAISGGSGSIVINGLPYSVANSELDYFGAVNVASLDFNNSASYLTLETSSNGESLVLAEVHDNGTNQAILVADLTNTTRINGTLSYLTNDAA